MALRKFASILFQAGPVQTSTNVKSSVLIDYGSRDPNFGRQVEQVKSKILSLNNLSSDSHSCVIMQGPPSYISESLLSTIKLSENLMILSNGKLGDELIENSSILKIPHQVHKTPAQISPSFLSGLNFDSVSHIALVHEETTGLINPIKELSSYLKTNYPNVIQIINGSQALDWIYLNLSEIDFYYSSFHTIIQAFNGISFCVAKNATFHKTKGKYSSLALDLYDQCAYQKENPGQFRFTPPTHLIAAAYAGIQEWENEGVNKRFLRLRETRKRLVDILSMFGFELALPFDSLGFSCLPLKFPLHKNWNFSHFCAHLKRKGFNLNAEHMSDKNFIELGTAGDIHLDDVVSFAKAVEEVLTEMRIPLPLKVVKDS